MNKYQETLEFIKSLKSRDSQQEANFRSLEDIVQELVDKETAMKPNNFDKEYFMYNCPNCNKLIATFKLSHCPHCGQKLDWNWNDE